MVSSRLARLTPPQLATLLSRVESRLGHADFNETHREVPISDDRAQRIADRARAMIARIGAAMPSPQRVIFRIKSKEGHVYGCKACTERLQQGQPFPNALGADIPPEEELRLEHVTSMVAVHNPEDFSCDGCLDE